LALPCGVEAYVAMDQRATCIAIVRDGVLLGARELPWGYATGGEAGAPYGTVSRRADLANRLGDELAAFLDAAAAGAGPLTQVAICGGLPELRTMAVALMERLDVEVETLDSLFGIGATEGSGTADDFRDRASELRVVWAAAADWAGPINLIRDHLRRQRRTLLARAAAVAVLAAGLGAGFAIERSQPEEPPRPSSQAVVTVPGTPPDASAPAAPMPSPSVVESTIGSPMPPPQPLAATSASSSDVPAPLAATSRKPTPAGPPPFTELAGILYSPGRKLAIVNDFVVGPGDEVNGARIVDITASTVLLRDARGRLRVLTLGNRQPGGVVFN
jgi:hypothetical protein